MQHQISVLPWYIAKVSIKQQMIARCWIYFKFCARTGQKRDGMCFAFCFVCWTSLQPNIRTLNVAIVGARGYVGGELALLLARHPHLNLTAAFSRSLGGTRFGDSMPQLKDEARHSAKAREMSQVLFSDATPEAVVAAKCDVVVLALPNGASTPFVDAIANAGGSLKSRPLVVDVSADGRFTPSPRVRCVCVTSHCSI
jgi:hypothetical protein